MSEDLAGGEQARQGSTSQAGKDEQGYDSVNNKCNQRTGVGKGWSKVEGTSPKTPRRPRERLVLPAAQRGASRPVDHDPYQGPLRLLHPPIII
eukprot:7324408-Pyramimonas_sp.AAC.1